MDVNCRFKSQSSGGNKITIVAQVHCHREPQTSGEMDRPICDTAVTAETPKIIGELSIHFCVHTDTSTTDRHIFKNKCLGL